MAYDVPRAAEVEGDELTYRPDIDPQGLARPSAISVTLHLPPGSAVVEMPEGWVALDADTIARGGPALISQQSFKVKLSLTR
ncbi:hypothetical protein [Nocardioides sp. B-3]|uniref:hypothetical protein n=1 Tax=Nocardioides sp. B-3 TaxID=2895565 RepID=UPI002152C1FD|nr:hypothetical protein [Nocardioides sp. B-3]UUZ57665.1 hypothetical protein LP418_14540 [Nocardioides sp. B-3]